MEELAESGVAILYVSSEMEEVLGWPTGARDARRSNDR